jgi:hypothetical protein
MTDSRNSLYYWFAVFAICFVAYQQVQDHLRPGYDGQNALIIYALGVAPNFFPAAGIPALFVVLIPLVTTNKSRKPWITGQRHLTANLISVTGLLGWEFTQIITAKGRFDWNDVLWTLVGAGVFVLIWQATPERLKVLISKDKAPKL